MGEQRKFQFVGRNAMLKSWILMWNVNKNMDTYILHIETTAVTVREQLVTTRESMVAEREALVSKREQMVAAREDNDFFTLNKTTLALLA